MQFPAKALALSTLLATQACVGIGALEALGGSCEQEQLVVTFPVTITRGGSVTNPLITRTLTPENIGQSQFTLLRQILVGGAAGSYSVTWTVNAFDANGHIAFRHPMPIANGEIQQVGAVFTGGAWSAQPATPALPPAVSVRAENFVATSASGSITALNSVPLRLRFDVTTTSATGEAIRLVGEAGFTYDIVTTSCI